MKIECTLPNASEEISGIAFAKSEAGTMVSVDDVDPAEAARLLKIDGFREAADGSTEGDKKAEDSNLTALREQAEALGIKVSQRWGEARLRSEIEQVSGKTGDQ